MCVVIEGTQLLRYDKKVFEACQLLFLILQEGVCKAMYMLVVDVEQFSAFLCFACGDEMRRDFHSWNACQSIGACLRGFEIY